MRPIISAVFVQFWLPEITIKLLENIIHFLIKWKDKPNVGTEKQQFNQEQEQIDSAVCALSSLA